MRKFLIVVLAVLMTGFGAVSGYAQEKVHKLAIHVDQNDPAVMNMALNNAQNVYSYYQEKGEKVTIELVAYGPGLNMFVAGKSPVANRLSTMSMEMSDLQFSACGNTLKGMEKKAGKKIDLVSEANVVPSGVVRLMELQEEGYSYVRP